MKTPLRDALSSAALSSATSAPELAPAHLFSRRGAMQIGAGLFGLSLPQWLRQRALAENAPPRDISCIFLFLAGGASHFETFDPKPSAPVEIRGLWSPTQTSVPGTLICEKMPLMAQRMHKVAIVRSWRGVSGSHSTGSQHVASGMAPPPSGQRFPNFGCLLAALRGNRVPGVPAHFGLPVAARYTKPAGYLGASHAAVDLDGDPADGNAAFAKLSLARERFDERQVILSQLDELGRLSEVSDRGIDAVDKFSGEALELLTTGRIRRALDLSDEPQSLRERYGDNIYGRRVLLARRLVEAGARFVTINQAVQGGLFGAGKTNGTWDNHHLLFESMMSFAEPPANIPGGYKWARTPGPGNLPQLDMSLSTLLDDLEDRGLLDTTLVVAMGEFGRTPKINKDGGRDHYPGAGSVLLAGAGIARGAVVGATDRNGAEPKTRPWTPEDFAYTIYSALGLNPHQTHFPRLTRPTPIATGSLIEGLL
ncbi:MAG: DUF1501 domain-containing protein [Planctomycetales bacterium]|nr:DUF1501 domain-containing protein [Planctomycetales bacterium]